MTQTFLDHFKQLHVTFKIEGKNDDITLYLEKSDGDAYSVHYPKPGSGQQPIDLGSLEEGIANLCSTLNIDNLDINALKDLPLFGDLLTAKVHLEHISGTYTNSSQYSVDFGVEVTMSDSPPTFLGISLLGFGFGF